MLKKTRLSDPGNKWNRLARSLIYDAKQVLLYCGVRVPERGDYAVIVDRLTRGTNYGAIYDPTARRIHFDPSYIQNIVDMANRFDFPVFDKAFGFGGIAGFIQKGDGDSAELKSPTLEHILMQAMMAKNHDMPYAYVAARQLAQFEVEQIGVMAKIFEGPIFLNVSTSEGIAEAAAYCREGHYIIAIHTVFQSPLTLASTTSLETFMACVEAQIPAMMVTQPLSGQNGPITPYGIALLAFAEFLAGMAFAFAVNPETKIINGAYPTMCTAGSRPELKIGSVAHNYTNYLVAYTSRLLDVASIQSGCTIEGSTHRNEILETDYQTVRAMILWETLFEGWHMVRHCYGLLADLACFSFEKARDDIAALHHIQSLDESGITAVRANNVRLHRDMERAEAIYQNPTLLFSREKDEMLDVILETLEVFRGDFGKHDHTLRNIPSDWF